MFARFLEMTLKPEKKTELFKKVREEVLPILRKYSGFMNVINMEVETEPAKVYLISIWHDKLDAEKYEKESFAKVKAMYEPFLTLPIVVKPCKVDETTFKQVTSIAA
jgi:quinol monooxygenase YgiN